MSNLEQSQELSPDRNILVCDDGCGSSLVFPVGWIREGAYWVVQLRCPDCHTDTEKILSRSEARRLDEEMERAEAQMVEAVAEASEDEVSRFARALQVGGILPEDF